MNFVSFQIIITYKYLRACKYKERQNDMVRGRNMLQKKKKILYRKLIPRKAITQRFIS